MHDMMKKWIKLSFFGMAIGLAQANDQEELIAASAAYEAGKFAEAEPGLRKATKKLEIAATLAVGVSFVVAAISYA